MMAGKFLRLDNLQIEIWGAILSICPHFRNWAKRQQRQVPGCTTDPNPGHTLVALDTCGAHTVVP